MPHHRWCTSLLRSDTPSPCPPPEVVPLDATPGLTRSFRMSAGCARMTVVREVRGGRRPGCVYSAPHYPRAAWWRWPPAARCDPAGQHRRRARSPTGRPRVRPTWKNPGHVLAVTFTTRPRASCGRLRELDGPTRSGLDRGGAHLPSAALAPVLSTSGRTPSAATQLTCSTRRSACSQAAARARGVPASGPELRDLATEVEREKVMQVRPED
jgi:hypothetical protein